MGEVRVIVIQGSLTIAAGKTESSLFLPSITEAKSISQALRSSSDLRVDAHLDLSGSLPRQVTAGKDIESLRPTLYNLS